jgi:hypothetical protein
MPTNSLAAYLPATILPLLADDQQQLTTPFRQCFDTAVLFCDVAGYTKLCEQCAARRGGDELLASVLNACRFNYHALLLKKIWIQAWDKLTSENNEETLTHTHTLHTTHSLAHNR